MLDKKVVENEPAETVLLSPKPRVTKSTQVITDFKKFIDQGEVSDQMASKSEQALPKHPELETAVVKKMPFDYAAITEPAEDVKDQPYMHDKMQSLSLLSRRESPSLDVESNYSAAEEPPAR